MTAKIMGPLTWTGERDEYGYRSYTLTVKVRTDNKEDGPAVVLQTPGLPQPGEIWEIGNDFDAWAWCRPNCKITPIVKDEPNFDWSCEYNFSSKPPNKDNQRCADQQVDDPLME